MDDSCIFADGHVFELSVGVHPIDFIEAEHWPFVEQGTLVSVFDEAFLIHGLCLAAVPKILLALQHVVKAVVRPPELLITTLFGRLIRRQHLRVICGGA
jgi:hypothetical protein